jgi:hypothetical protein
MAELPVKAAATNLITAIARLPTIATTIAVVDLATDDSFSISFTSPLIMKSGEFDQTNVASSEFELGERCIIITENLILKQRLEPRHN